MKRVRLVYLLLSSLLREASCSALAGICSLGCCGRLLGRRIAGARG